MKFSDKVYNVTKKIPKGKVSTYRDIAKALKTKAYRAVGSALACNPYSSVPCHRIVKSNGFIGGFQGKIKGRAVLEKIRMLRKEGIKIKNNKIVDFDKVVYKF